MSFSKRCPFSVAHKTLPLTKPTLFHPHLRYHTFTNSNVTLSPQDHNHAYSMYLRNLPALVETMIVTGVLLVPTAVPTAIPSAVQDLQDLEIVIDTAATSINEAPSNSRWGFFDPAAPAGPLGTADLVSNVTTTVLRATYLLNTNKALSPPPPPLLPLKYTRFQKLHYVPMLTAELRPPGSPHPTLQLPQNHPQPSQP